LDFFSESLGEQLPPGPVFLGHSVFDGKNGRILPHPVGPEFDHLRGGLLEAREHDFHARLHACSRQQLDRVDMPIEAGLSQRDFEPMAVGAR
jgi:hypothetical protein